MKKAFVILAVLGLILSPAMVSQASAAPVKHSAKARHHTKGLKKHGAKRSTRKHLHKAAV